MSYDDAGEPGLIDPTVHYAALIRLQVTVSALQQMLWADTESPRYQEARENAQAAILIALGGRSDVPPRLMKDWADLQMRRDAPKVLAATGREITP